MSKQRKSNREDKKKPAMSLKEKRAARKSRDQAHPPLIQHGKQRDT